jgi:tetratricopeptide (TPR) repeat protein
MNFKQLLYFAFAALFAIAIASCGNNGDQPVKNGADTAAVDSSAAGLAELNKKILADPNNPDLYHQRAKYEFERQKDVQAALADMGRALKIDSTRAPYFITLSDLYFTVNKSGNAKAALEKALEVDPKNTEAMMKLAELYLYVKKYQKSIDYINMALKVDQYNAKGYFMKGMNYKEIGDTAKAISSMETAVEQDPQYYAAYLQLGILYAAKKDPLAESYYNNALRVDPRSTEAMYNKGKFYQDMQNWNAAIATYNDLLKIDPNYKYASFNLGVIHLVNLKVYEEALKYFNNAIAADSEYKEAYYGRGTCYQAMGDVKRAAADYQQALVIDPQYEPARIALKSLK